MVEYFDTWRHGLAFTGGPMEWEREPCGERQAVLTFETPKTFELVRVWHHGGQHIPDLRRVEYWNETSWQSPGETSTLRSDLAHDSTDFSAGSVPTEHVFPAVTSTKVRFVLDNCPMIGDGHGWIYEFEVFGPFE